MNRACRTILIAGAAVASLAASPANALTIVLTDLGGLSRGSEAWIGFSAAANYWETVITDDVTVNISVGFSDLGAGILGEAYSPRDYYSTAAYEAALIGKAHSALDASVVANLGKVTSDDYSLYNALGKAVGLRPADAEMDAYIGFNTGYAFDFDTSDGFTGVSSDFVGVAVHEIGHALGWASGVNSSGGGIPANTDFLRYQDGAWSQAWGGNPYLSIDGGKTQLFGRAAMANGTDGRQPSHWKDGGRIHDGVHCTILTEPQIGIMDPTGGACQQGIVTAADLAVIDAIGWTLSFDVLANPGYTFDTAQIRAQFLAGVPEPATWGMMILGFGMVGGAMRRRGGVVRVVA